MSEMRPKEDLNFDSHLLTGLLEIIHVEKQGAEQFTMRFHRAPELNIVTYSFLKTIGHSGPQRPIVYDISLVEADLISISAKQNAMCSTAFPLLLVIQKTCLCCLIQTRMNVW